MTDTLALWLTRVIIVIQVNFSSLSVISFFYSSKKRFTTLTLNCLQGRELTGGHDWGSGKLKHCLGEVNWILSETKGQSVKDAGIFRHAAPKAKRLSVFYVFFSSCFMLLIWGCEGEERVGPCNIMFSRAYVYFCHNIVYLLCISI